MPVSNSRNEVPSSVHKSREEYRMAVSRLSELSSERFDTQRRLEAIVAEYDVMQDAVVKNCAHPRVIRSSEYGWACIDCDRGFDQDDQPVAEEVSVPHYINNPKVEGRY